MNNHFVSVAYSTFINKGAIALLLGSGISRKAGIPTGWDIMLHLIQQIAIIEKERISTTPFDWYVKKFEEDPDYSDILEKLTTTQEERINLLKPFIEPSEEEFEEGLKKPTKAHHFIAQLVRLGYIRVIVTTNFDRLIENALKEIGIEPTIISNPGHVENSIPLIHSPITIIKINGDYLDTGFLNLKSELESYDSRLEPLIKEVFENFGLITCGWSAKWDLALVNLLKSSNKFRFSNFFTHLNEPDLELSELSNFRRGHLIKIDDADSFFYELHEDISVLERNSAEHPLSPKIALARAKKYIAKEEFKIQLHDLISNVCDESFGNIYSYPFPSPTLESLKIVMDYYLAQMRTLSNIMAEVVFWSKDYHSRICIDVIKRSGDIDFDQNKTSIVMWSNIQYFPSLILRYVEGIAAVSKGDFKLLNSILEIEFFDRYSSKNILQLTIPGKVIEDNILNKVFERRYYTPMSETLHKYLRPFFKSIIPVDKEYDIIFDYYEFICALSFLKNSKHNEGWAPIGRFGHRDKALPKRKLELAKNQQQEFELIKYGLFKSYEDFEKAANSFNDFFENVTARWW